MTTHVDLELFGGVDLPYVTGAEYWLVELDPAYDVAWQALVATFPGLALDPLFGEVESLDELVAQAVALGNEPPRMTAWFAVACPDELVEAIQPALYALPFVLQAVIRRRPVPAGRVSWGTNPRMHDCLQFQTPPAGVNALFAWQVRGGTGRDARVADVEDGWSFDHEELKTTTYIEGSSIWGTPPQDVINHGTASVGVIAAPDNGVGMVGIAPDAGITVISVDRGGVPNVAAAILLAARALGAGGILLVEVAEPFIGALDQPDVAIEFNPAAQAAIRLATALGVTVSPDVPMATVGPLARGTASDNVVLLGVDTVQNLRVTVRAWAGGTYCPLEVIGPSFPADDVGGMTALNTDAIGLVAMAMHSGTGQCHLTSTWDGITWSEPTGFP